MPAGIATKQKRAGGDHGYLLTPLTKQPHGRIAAGIPAFERLRFLGVEYAVPQVTAPFAFRKGGPLEIALHRAQTHPDLLRNDPWMLP